MTTEVVALKVQINRGPHGAVYPEFNRVRLVSQSGLDWSMWVDQYGGWIYDSLSGHDDDTDGSGRGMQWGMLLVPEEFAIEACEKWKTCHLMSPGEAHTFFSDRHAYRIPRLRRDAGEMQAIKLEIELHTLLEDEAETEEEKETHRRRKRSAMKDAASAVDADSPQSGVNLTRSGSLQVVLAERGLTLKGESSVS